MNLKTEICEKNPRQTTKKKYKQDQFCEGNAYYKLTFQVNDPKFEKF